MDDFENCLGLQLKLTKNIMDVEHNTYLKKYGISNEQGFLLKYVYEFPGQTQTQIAEAVHKDKTTITRMIDTLVKKGKLERKSTKDDRRVFRIHVTEKTQNEIKEISPIFEKRHEELKALIDEEDYKTALNVLKIVKKYYQGLNR